METSAPTTMRLATVAAGSDGHANGVKKLAALVRSYFELGGQQMQFNVVSSETLRDAQKHPDAYQDLLVRVAGFSAYFVTIDPAIQEDIIDRTEHDMA
jgi:trans-4-hydroxy-L-proline dehydratase